MKKVAIGCLAVFLIVGGIGGFLAYRYVVRPMQGVAKSLEQVEKLADFNKRVVNKIAFNPPEDGVISSLQLERYLAVQDDMKQSLSQTLEKLNIKYKDFEGKEPNLSNIREFFGAYQDILRLVLEAKEVQVDALNKHNFSLAEYAWVKREALRAVALPFGGLDLSQLGEGNVQLPPLSATVPEENIKRLEPYKEKLEDVLGLAFFGL